MKLTRYIFGALILSGMISMSSCTDDRLEETLTNGEISADDDGMVDVTLNFALDVFDPATRTRGEGDDTGIDLKDIDLLIYAVRDSTDRVLFQYGQGVDKQFKKGEDIDDETYPAFKNYQEDTDNNQTLLKVNWTKTDAGVYSMDRKVTLRVMRGTVFKLSVWAQSSKTEAYDFNYLTAVKVNYDGALNNQEERAVFCATSIFSIGQIDSEVTVTLTRPLAQVNVGVLKETNENSSTALSIDPNFDTELAKYSKSQIVLGGAAKYFNVVENRTWTSAEIARLLDRNDSYGENYNDDVRAMFEADKDQNGVVPDTQDVTFDFNFLPTGNNAEFVVHDYSNWSGGSDKLITHTYQSISMSYVLVPEMAYAKDEEGNYTEDAGSTTNPSGNNKWVTDTDGNTVKLKLNNNVWEIDEVYNSKGEKLSGSELTNYKTKYSDGEITFIENGIVSPVTPAEPQVTLTLFSLSLKDDSGNNSITYYPKEKDDEGNDTTDELLITVKRNWRSNLLFNNWDWTKSAIKN